MKSNKFTTSQLTILGLMSGILFLMAYTPLGYLNIGPLQLPLMSFRSQSVRLFLDRQEEPWLELSLD